MNDIKISMLGVSGSGKTSFLSGICDTFISGNIEVFDSKNSDESHLFRILPHYADQTDETNIGDIRRFSIRNNKGFSSVSTENTKKYILDIHDDTYDPQNPLCSVSFIDYKGGFIEKLVNERSDDDVKDVRNELLSSNVILIFVDSIKLSSSYSSSQFSALGCDDINTFFNTNKFANSKISVLFVLTKDDAPSVDQDNELLTDRIMHAFETTVKIIQRNKWNLGIIRTSAVGRNNVDPETNRVNPDAEIIPYGIDSVLFYSIYKTVGQEITDICLKTSDMEKASVLKKLSKEYKNREKILKMQLEETEAVLKCIRIPYNYLKVRDSLIWEFRNNSEGISSVN